MTVRVSKPAFNVRDKLSELDKPVGVKGTELMRSETIQDARNVINAGRKNLIINGSMQVAQYGTSISVEGYACDRWNYLRSGINEELTFSQSSLTSSDIGPWGAGFRNCLKIQNGNQTGGAGSNDYGIARYKIEAQDIANCGWDYTSPNSYVTLSYWIKSSVAQNFYQYLRTHDGTAQAYTWETGTLIKDAWKKVIVKIPGDADITINDDTGIGMMITIPLFWGGTWTDNSVELNKWRGWNTNYRTPDYDGKWWTTDDATLSLTGVQLEVGSEATSFEFRHYQEELKLCERYYERYWQNNNSSGPGGGGGDGYNTVATGAHNGSSGYYTWAFRTQKRARPSLDYDGKFRVIGGATISNQTPNEFYSPGADGARIRVGHSGSSGQAYLLEFDGGNSSNGYLEASAEI